MILKKKQQTTEKHKKLSDILGVVRKRLQLWLSGQIEYL